jgi:hypothetical protein
MLLDGFKALNQNTMKNAEGQVDVTAANDITVAGKAEEGEAF